MPVKNWKFLPVLWVVLLWRFYRTKAYTDICEETYQNAYCSCDTSHRETTVSCFFFGTVLKNDSIWTSLTDVDNVVSLTLNSQLPTKLNYIPVEALQKMPNLLTFTIRIGSLGELQPHAVSDVASLNNLELDGNEITGMQPYAISKLPKLKKLSLSENLLQELRAESLSELLELEQLFLDRNNISRIESCAFCDLQNLKELELWGNQITDLTEYTFRGLRYLKRLDLFKNQISILNDKIFQSMPKLMELDLNENLINHIAPRAFHGLHKLQRLLLNSNRIKILPDDVFKSLPNLMSVDLYNNLLETLQGEVIHHMTNSKKEHFSMAFKDNPYKCNCEMRWVKTYLKVNESHQFTRELEDVQCVSDTNTKKIVLHYLRDTNCESSATTKPRAITTSQSVTKSKVPIELNSHKPKTITTASDVDDAYVSDDDDDDDQMENKQKADVNDNHDACGRTTSDSRVIICIVILVTLLSSRWKGT